MATSTGRAEWDAERRGALLATTRLFGGLPPDVLAAVAARCRPRRLRRGATVFLEGDPAEAVYLLAAGRVKLVQETEDGRAVILRLLHAGDVFNVAGGRGEARYPATGIALDDAVILHLPVADFEALIADHATVALAVVRELAARLRVAEERIRELQTERADRRIARTLLRLVGDRAGVEGDGGSEVALSRQDLADLCGTTLSTASRVLAAWHRQGLLIAGRERIVIRRLDGLVAIAEGRTSPERGWPTG
jgi:CRP-like cAMP-binding protein